MADRKIYFATDIHGSQVCLRKFLNAGKFYGCDTLIMGGDITGKMIVPIVDRGQGRRTATLYGRSLEVMGDDIARLRKTIADAGFYAYDTTPEEMEHFRAHPEAVTELFGKLMHETLNGWLELAEDRLAGTGIQCFFAPGNDDPVFIDDILATSATVINPEEAPVDLGDGFTMISVGYSNQTPWDSPRELPEAELAAYIGRQAESLGDTGRVIFNFHVPPQETPIDQASLLDAEFRPVMKGGMPVIAGVGSSAVREALEKYQPMLSLHGHIHESRGEARIGRTLAINPGSEYSEGVLRGAIVTLSKKKGVRGYQLVAAEPDSGDPRGPAMTIGVVGSARLDPPDPRCALAAHVGAGVARRGWTLLTGGYGGLMAVSSQAAAEAGGRVVGLPMRGWGGLTPNPWNHELRWSDTYAERLAHLLAADAVIVLDGGIGTLSEAATVWAALQTEPDAADLVFVGAGWEPVLAALAAHLVIDDRDLAHVTVCASADEAVAQIARTRSRQRDPGRPRG